MKGTIEMETGLNFEINILSLNRGSAAESMFRKCAIEKYVLPNAGIRKMISVDAPISVQQCFRQMKRNQLDEIAAFLLEEKFFWVTVGAILMNGIFHRLAT